MCKTLQRSGVVKENRKLTDTLFLLDIESSEIAKSLKPGQFIHVRIPGMDHHILRRPFSVYQVDRAQGTLSVLYQTVGEGTRHLAALPAPFSVDIIGPVGNCWQAPEDAQRILLVAGGVGAAPLYIFADQLVSAGKEVDVVLGAQSKEALVARETYEALLGREPYCATDDGSWGYHGFCTGVVSELIESKRYDWVACCGPEPMMKTVAEITLGKHIPTAISLEKRMACGIGACLSCVVMTQSGYKRSCVDGPIFDAAEVVWE
jgi:dihydroorotate dehydrogenase electron transfer subunit